MIKSNFRKLLQVIKSKNKLSSKNEPFIGKNYYLERFLSLLVELDFKPKHIVDIGANHGDWTRKALNYFPDANFTLIEPQEELFKFYKDFEANKNIGLYNLGISNEKGVLNFTIHDRDDSSSFAYSKIEADKLGYNQILVETNTLENLVFENKLIQPDMIKIDAEGHDIEVLEGCESLFSTTEVILVEASVTNYIYNNKVIDIINFMDKKGYSLFDITDINRPLKVKVLWLLELAFARKDGYLLKNSKITV
jgi:FkbM family methyltransferase